SWSVTIICARWSIWARRSPAAGSSPFLGPAAWVAPATSSTPSTIHIFMVQLLVSLAIQVSEQPGALERERVLLERDLAVVPGVGAHRREEALPERIVRQERSAGRSGRGLQRQGGGSVVTRGGPPRDRQHCRRGRGHQNRRQLPRTAAGHRARPL